MLATIARFVSIGIGILLTSAQGAIAAPAPVAPRPLAVLGQGVTVRGYPVGDGGPDFPQRRAAAGAAAVADAIASRGPPLLRDGSLDDAGVRLVYRDGVVAITGYYSNNVICRVDIPASGIGAGFEVADVTALAARACRVAEEQGWGTAGYTAPTPIGTDILPKLPGARLQLYATDQLFGLFPQLVRGAELKGGSRATLIHGNDRDARSLRDGEVEWRYAWLGDGTILGVRYLAGPRGDRGVPGVGIACAIVAPAAALERLDTGPFVDWCERQTARLTPGLQGFVAAVWADRNARAQADPTGNTTVSMYGGFHIGALSPALAEAFWKTGTVAPPAH